MNELNYLSRRMDDLNKELPELGNSLAKETGLIVIKDLIKDTPVDVSTALSGWQIGLNYPVTSPRIAFHEGKHGSTFSASSQATITDAANKLSIKEPSSIIYISNNENYISDLNSGTSSQHPGGFIEMSVAHGRRYLNNINK